MNKHIATPPANILANILIWLDRSPASSRAPTVLADFADFSVRDGHRAALSHAASGGTATAVLAAATDEDITEAVKHELARYGATRIICLRLAEDSLNSPEALATAFIWALGQSLFTDTPVTDIVATANAAGRDFMARVAAHRNAPLLQDCVAVNFAKATGEKYLLQGRTCGVYSLPGQLRCWTLRPHEFPCHSVNPSPETAPAGWVDLTPPQGVSKVRASAKARADLEEAETDPLARMWAEQPDIMEASVIISGGRSLESAENFRLLHETAAPLHAAVGASRSAVDMGYAPPFVQVGQTGVVVSPELYIACGISGSIFHTTGIKGARKVAAINKDKTAPIFLRADYGITDDLFTVLPLLREILESQKDTARE